MNQDWEPFDEEEPIPASSLPRRRGPGLDLTGMPIRIAATVIVIGLGILIIYFALRPSPTEVADIPPTEEVSGISVDVTQPLATFTPGATSTPPPLDEPTPEPPAAPEEAAAGELTVGGTAVVTGTNGLGVNLRQESATTSAIIQVLPDDTPLTVTDGPVEAEDFVWWRVQLEDGTEGWIVQDYLAP